MSDTRPIRYHSPFLRWDELSSVRARRLGDQKWSQEAHGDWFSTDGWSVADHASVAQSALRSKVLAATLLGYLDFTVRLEEDCIVPACRDLALGHLGIERESEIVRDALRVQCDEAFHALMCEQLAQHVVASTGLSRVSFPDHLFFSAVESLRPREGSAVDAAQYRFCVAVVAETVITDSLHKDWSDSRLRPEVRELLRNHYNDELRHAAFFSKMLRLAWPRWSPAARDALTPVWPELVAAFTRADGEIAMTTLRMAGFGSEEAGIIAAESLARSSAPARSSSQRLAVLSLRRAGVPGFAASQDQL